MLWEHRQIWVRHTFHQTECPEPHPWQFSRKRSLGALFGAIFQYKSQKSISPMKGINKNQVLGVWFAKWSFSWGHTIYCGKETQLIWQSGVRSQHSLENWEFWLQFGRKPLKLEVLGLKIESGDQFGSEGIQFELWRRRLWPKVTRAMTRCYWSCDLSWPVMTCWDPLRHVMTCQDLLWPVPVSNSGGLSGCGPQDFLARPNIP